MRGKIAFGGSTPCAQTAGEKRFYDEFQNPNDLLFNGEYRHIPVFFGANSHEGSFVYQCKSLQEPNSDKEGEWVYKLSILRMDPS